MGLTWKIIGLKLYVYRTISIHGIIVLEIAITNDSSKRLVFAQVPVFVGFKMLSTFSVLLTHLCGKFYS